MKNYTSINKQYTYTYLEQVITALRSTDGKSILVKNGQAIEQPVDVRIKQQNDASRTSKNVKLNEFTVEDALTETKLDDRIRDLLHKEKNYDKYNKDVYNLKKDRNEWTYVNIEKILKKYDSAFVTDFYKAGKNERIFITERFFDNPDLLSAIGEQIGRDKMAVVKQLKKVPYTPFTLRTHQLDLVDSMIASKLDYFTLGLAPRFGKTITVLDYCKQLNNNKIVLVPASKSLASNSSFSEDYKEGSYDRNFKLLECSLFKDEEIAVDELAKTVSKKTPLILVIDEADHASHTKNSVQKLKTIFNNFNVIKVIAMSGTAVYKADKIFKGLSIDTSDVFVKNIDYTDLLETQEDYIVRRRCFNMRFDMDIMAESGKDILNINETFKSPNEYQKLKPLLDKALGNDNYMIDDIQLVDTKVVMIFCPGIVKAHIGRFMKLYNDSPEYETLELTGNVTNNRNAAKKVKSKLKEMKKLESNKQLLVFSLNMGSRSFSVPAIRRVILLGDTELNSSSIQKAARCVTYDTNKAGIQTADLIRITFADDNLAAELFMQEHGKIDRTKETKTKISSFLNASSFIDTVFKDGKLLATRSWGTDLSSIDKFIDDAIKAKDTTKRFVAAVFGEGIVSYNNTTGSESKTTKVEHEKPKNYFGDTKNKKTTNTPTKKENEKQLELYLDIVRTIPYVLSEDYNITNVDDVLDANWESSLSHLISKEDFITNLGNKNFEEHFSFVIRAFQEASSTKINDMFDNFYIIVDEI
jgi:hypothetical protein